MYRLGLSLSPPLRTPLLPNDGVTSHPLLCFPPFASRHPACMPAHLSPCERERNAGAILAGGGDSGSRLRGVPWLLQLCVVMSQRYI